MLAGLGVGERFDYIIKVPSVFCGPTPPKEQKDASITTHPYENFVSDAIKDGIIWSSDKDYCVFFAILAITAAGGRTVDKGNPDSRKI
jgi:hypothetical protein